MFGVFIEIWSMPCSLPNVHKCSGGLPILGYMWVSSLRPGRNINMETTHGPEDSPPPPSPLPSPLQFPCLSFPHLLFISFLFYFLFFLHLFVLLLISSPLPVLRSISLFYPLEVFPTGQKMPSPPHNFRNSVHPIFLFPHLPISISFFFLSISLSFLNNRGNIMLVKWEGSPAAHNWFHNPNPDGSLRAVFLV